MKRVKKRSSRNTGKSTFEKGVGLTGKIVLILRGIVDIYRLISALL